MSTRALPHQEEPTPNPVFASEPAIAGMTGAELSEAKSYGRLALFCALADKVIDVAYLAVAAFLLARPIDAALQNYASLADDASLRLAALFLIVIILHLLASFPLSLYSGHILEHRFQLSTQSFRRWLWQYAKRNLLAAAFSLLVILALYWIIWTTGGIWWLLAAGAFFVVSIVLGQLAPVLILPLFYRIEKLDAPILMERIGRMAENAGLSIEGVYRMNLSDETVKANAMLAGLGRTRRVLLGDTLIDGFEPDEIEVVFAHEIGHHVFHHIRWMIAAGLFYSAAGFWVCDRLLVWWVARSGTTFDYAQMPVDTLPFLLLILTVFGLVLQPLQNIVSRRFERQCDRFALEQTGLKEAYLSAFQKLARLNKDDPNPHWLDIFLFHSHPSVAERLAMAEEVASRKASPTACSE